MKNYLNTEISIPHEEMIRLRRSGKLNLGLNNDVAIKIADDVRYAPKSVGTSAAMHFWSWVAVGQFIFCVYLSFNGIWWLFIPSFFAAIAIHRANKKGTAQNLLDEAHHDKDFYERIRQINGWLYQTDEETAEKFKVK